MPKKKTVANPEYFTEVPPKDWDIIDYLDRSLSPATATTYGLSYLDESGRPSEMAESHGRNMYRWKEALKDISRNPKNQAARLLLRSREVCLLHWTQINGMFFCCLIYQRWDTDKRNAYLLFKRNACRANAGPTESAECWNPTRWG